LTTPTPLPADAPNAEADSASGSDTEERSHPEVSDTTGGNADAQSAPPAVEVPDSTPGSTKNRTFQSLFDLLYDLAIAVVVCVLLITYVVQAFKVQGTSMSPELGNGQRILVNKFIYRFDDIERGDVVVFWYPEDPELSFIKRIVGLPGETIEIRSGTVYVDGERLEEPYVAAMNADRRSHGPISVRPGHYFVLGDNRRGSNDSRSWGLVPERYIYGLAFARIWPPREMGVVD